MEGIFISHASEEDALVTKLAELLKEQGIEVWYDHCEESYGVPWVPLANNAIEKCGVFLLIWTKNAKKSFWVEREWSAALVREKRRIVPCLFDETPLPDMLQIFPYIEFQDFNKGYLSLLNCLQKGIENKDLNSRSTRYMSK